MRIQSVNNFQIYDTKPSFRQEIPEKSFALTDSFISETEQLSKKNKEGNWLAKNLRSITASWVSCGLVLAYELAFVAKIKNITDNIQKKKMSKKFLIGLAPVCLLAIGVFAAIQKAIDKNAHKSAKENENLFNSLNKTNAKYNKDSMNSMTTGAVYDVISGNVTVNGSYSSDPLGRLKLKKLLKHELEHAKQFEMIASLEDGTEKLNYTILKSFAEAIAKTPGAVREINSIYEELQNDTEGKYDNVKINIGGSHNDGVSVKKYITGIKLLLDDKNIDYKKLPMIINKEHYQEALKKRGELTEDEKKEAENYLKAFQNYPPLNIWNTINPFSAYWTNPLEKGARKASRQKN